MLTPIAKHPINDPKFPSFQRKEYTDMKPYLDFMLHMEIGPDRWMDLYGNCSSEKIAEKILKKFPNEERNDWLYRLSITDWHPVFRPVLESIPGFINKISPKDTVFKGLLSITGDIDLASNSLRLVSTSADYLVLRDQLCFAFLDFWNPDSKEITEADILTSDIRPFLKILDRRDVPNWSYRNNKFDFIVMREEYDGNYRYRKIYSDGSWILLEIHDGLIKDEFLIVEIDNGKISLGTCPVFVYALDNMHPFTALPPLMDIARLQVSLYNLESEDRLALVKQGFNILVIKGANVSSGNNLSNTRVNQDNDGQIKTGILRAINLRDSDSGASFISPSADWADVYQNRKAAIESKVDKLTNTFIGNAAADSAVIYKSKLEVGKDSDKEQAQIVRLIEAKLSLLDRVEKGCCDYYGVKQVYPSGEFNNFIIGEPPLPEPIVDPTIKPGN